MIELYWHSEADFLTQDLKAKYQNALKNLLPPLLKYPQGPTHVLSDLEEVEINIVDDATITRIHADFLNDPTPTDVITFPYGEIFVSLDTAMRYAKEHQLDVAQELFRYMVHGLVHLHGYLDATPEQRDELFSVQEPLVTQFMPQ